MACAIGSRIGPCPDRMMGLAVPGAASRADEMVRHLRHRHAPGQAEAPGVDIEMAHRPAGIAMDFQELVRTNQITDGDRLRPQRLRLAPAAVSVSVLLQLDELRERAISLEIRLASSAVSFCSDTPIRSASRP